MIQLITNIIIALAALLLTAAAVVGVAKIVRGPSSLDRVVAADLMVAVVIGAVGFWTATTDTPLLLLVVLILSLVGYTSASSVARLVHERTSGSRADNEREEPKRRP